MAYINQLNTCSNENTPYFSLDGVECLCKCINVYDGDTITVILKPDGFPDFFKFKIRLDGIDAPEIRTKNDVEKQNAILVRDFLRSMILNKIINIKCGKYDKYGRILATIKLQDSEKTINDILIEKKYAIKYDGGTKKSYIEPIEG